MPVISEKQKKMRENSNNCIRLRREKSKANSALVTVLGGKTGQYRRIIKETRNNGEKLREKLREKNVRKIEELEKKYGGKIEVFEELTEKENEEYGEAKLFQENCDMRGEVLREPEVVRGKDEVIMLSEEEKQVLALGPKFCVRKRLNEEEFDVDLEECIAKVKWEMMGEDMKNEGEKDLADVAIMAIHSDEEKEEIREYEEMMEARQRMVYEAEGKTWSYSRKRVTDTKGNSMVILPGRRKNFQEEANLEMLRAEMRGCFREYMRKYCNEKGDQESNLTRGEARGLKSLKKKFTEGSLVVLPTDKSGRFAIMSNENYMRAGSKHVSKDEIVNEEMISKTQNELNGNVSMLIKFTRMGRKWGHGDRMRQTMVNKSLTVCPMYLTYKDHKGWKGDEDTPPPTRPIAGGNTGMNLHISEILSEITEPVVEAYEGGNEVISTEDFKARIEVLNGKNQNWKPSNWWDGKRTECGEYEACTKCMGDIPIPTYEYENEDEELKITENDVCNCEENDDDEKNEDWENYWMTNEGGDTTFWTDEESWKTKWRTKNITKTSPAIIKKLRKLEWSKKFDKADLRDEERVWKSTEVLEEEIQDFEAEMVIIGCDVESLYPSLDRDETSRIIGEEILRSEIVWEDLDYLEGTRMIALNRSAEWCRTHELRRVLPIRRGKTGSRPGVTGKGPSGPTRGDQEQWKFPVVTLTEREKKLIVAEVTKITTEVMFDHHLYTFCGRVYRQRRGGPIGLRGTCAIARLVMCYWDRQWMAMMLKNRITIKEYF